MIHLDPSPTDLAHGHRLEVERTNLLTRIYNLEYIAIPALVREYQLQAALGRPESDVAQALQDAQTNLAALKKELLDLDPSPKRGWRQLHITPPRPSFGARYMRHR
jgi:hypothetical protein